MRSLAVSSTSDTYITVYDEFNDEWLFLSRVDFTSNQDQLSGRVYKLQIILNTNSPNFDWHTRITNVLVDDSASHHRCLAYSTSGTGFAFRSSDSKAACVELQGSSDITNDWEFVIVENGNNVDGDEEPAGWAGNYSVFDIEYNSTGDFHTY